MDRLDFMKTVARTATIERWLSHLMPLGGITVITALLSVLYILFTGGHDVDETFKMALLVGFTAGFFIALVMIVRDYFRGKLATAWTEFYYDSRWITPAGEGLKVIGSDYRGILLNGKYEDGYEQEFAITQFHPDRTADNADRLIAGVESVESGQKDFRRLKWQTRDGEAGIIRKHWHHRPYNDSPLIEWVSLKLDNGEVRNFEMDKLHPVAAAA